ncbi:NAD(P)/FAD-dependent oxidoreductase [Natrialba asiatica]|uniref:FAD-dependent pyridine nucleotide-disulfide oxidoreductase n=1 Tax=Natrialba asiatica (strain ATCC 700177 / DSM 12278 / JCM 9576 / FERM P-10747 / NBRC 102637 / 172P1) TaxID=29540 RepID=M0AY40_NATA1|nr:NAD(P)/FAD-dependent oxidoreductase [Natrialba asiatica]ELZ03420.1 FAD-dependent pyridine nucleotide-disulfide oxidoreductase [Natrialba asiatica DSM 12278]
MQTTDGSDLEYDVLIIGGGPAGLSAALQLGRSLRSVLVCDNGEPRNGPATEAHGYLTRDGIPPEELRGLGREEVMKYGGELRDIKVTDVSRDTNGFISTLDSGETVTSRKVVLATGVRDDLPDTDGFEEFWGSGVHHCPYCHGYEVRGEPLGVMVTNQHMVDYAKLIYNLSEDLVVFTDGQDVFDEESRSMFVERGIGIEDEPITALNGSDGNLESISLADGRDVARHALFYPPPMEQHSELPEQLGLEVNQAGLVDATRSQRGMGFTSVEGLFIAGDASSGAPPSIPSAVSDGYAIGTTVNMELSKEDFEGGRQ